MLLNNLKNKNYENNISKKEIISIKTHYPSPTREWKNSIYAYDKKLLRSIPYAEKSAINLIKGYFSMYNKNLEKTTRTKKMLNRLRKYSSNKIYFSQGEFKHTNNKTIITLYVYNRQRNNYISFMKHWYSNYLKGLALIFINRLKFINKQGLITLRKTTNSKVFLAKLLKNIENNKIYLYKYTTLSDYINKFYNIIISKSIKKIKIYYYYKQLLYINNNLLNYNYLHYLQRYLEYIYNKNVEFNLINVKRFFLNSDILSESITLKISRNRKKLLKYFNTLKSKVKVYKKKIYLGEPFKYNNLNIKQNVESEKIKLENLVLNNLKYKHITGFRLQGKGRLTRRYTASRSLSKTKYKGNLLDIDSSYRGLSTVLLRGNLKSNLQTTKLKSKTRIGSFGIKGWVSGN